ncbi:PQQ-dependent sugar dehydrogenase [Candidatus Uhrbacteria bacterium]|nr:PQQ-dependent sugar dehydrogenase [Candidatus Uhrbacteria bacterium]
MLKKSLVLLVFAVVFLSGAWVAVFAWKNLRGIGPALRPPAGDIARQIEEAASQTTSEERREMERVAENTTGLPLTLPPGFSISIFAKGLGGARVLRGDPRGNLLVSVPSAGTVLAFRDGKTITLLSGLKKPHGLAFRTVGGATQLYVAEEHAVSVYDYDTERLTASNRKTIVTLPSGGGHFTRTLLFQDDRLLISVGSSCNVCNERDPFRASVLSVNPDGSDLKEYATGLRNAVFLTTHPATGKVWATEMGRDLLGDDLPPDEINMLEEGKNYGWPICYGKNVYDTDFGGQTPVARPLCMEPFETPSTVDLPAHSAPLGLAFVPTDGWPEEFQGDLLVAFHGSWNRSVPTGYKIARLTFDPAGTARTAEDFIAGWLANDGSALGRPVDLLFHEGALYISDDKAGVIYRVTSS